MGERYFDDEQEISPQGLALLRRVLADLFRDQEGDSSQEEELGLARELVSLFKSGFRSEEELRAMAKRSRFLHQQDF
ncbi:hypothetical protein [Gellertiella hungarica]|jgi:hypothetical protein|uniref:Uncharacterized protein n=1 Tax=Gellertiella hungarica TaxID=1572859 RepID=A0A7W6J9R4_9HYPH|nr:hypothetical protein [Gellertiella hungarica]MBB4067409.1 hypothetical protein [Gellertiella hungarica]